MDIDYIVGSDVVGAQAFQALVLDGDAARSRIVDVLDEWVRKRVPYRWGGKSEETGLDCAGAVELAWEKAGVIPVSKKKRYGAGDLFDRTMRISLSEVKPGDLAFYGTPSRISHVMVWVGDGRVVGSSGGGPKTLTLEDARVRNAEVKYKPSYDYRKDFVAFGQAPIGYVLSEPSSSWWTMPAVLLAVGGASFVAARVVSGRKR